MSSYFAITGTIHFSSRKILVESWGVMYYVRTRSLKWWLFVHGDLVRARIVKRWDASLLSEVDILSLVRRSEDVLLWEFSELWGKIKFQILPEQWKFEKIFPHIPLGFSLWDIVEFKFSREWQIILLQKFASNNDFDKDEKILFRLAGIDTYFSSEIQKASLQIEERYAKQNTEQWDKRTDFRDWYTLTIDGNDAKDLDDAISLRLLPNGNTLLAVHIADVAEYVEEWSPIDIEACRRATSVYTPGKVIPMLPEVLSNDLCSLKPGTPKLTLSALMEIDSSGHVRHTDIVEWVIESAHRGVYEMIQDMRHNTIPKDTVRYQELSDTLELAYKLFETLEKRRKKEWKIIFTSTEVYFDFGESPKNETSWIKIPSALRKRKRLDSHMLIEECMILTNEEVAKWCDRHGIPFLSRIHGFPSSSALEIIRAIISSSHSLWGKSIHDINLQRISWGLLQKENKSKKSITPHEIRQFLDTITDPKDLYRLSRILLPKMAKAHYADKKSLHFGLALEYYAHFTSPIRRYPDLQVHRIIKEKIHGKLTPERIKHYQNILKKVANHSTLAEKNAEDIERTFDSLYACRYMQDKVWHTFKWQVSGLSEFALFIELENGIEWTLYLPRKRFHINQIQWTLETEEWNILYQIGDDIVVTIERVDMNERRIIVESK